MSFPSGYGCGLVVEQEGYRLPAQSPGSSAHPLHTRSVAGDVEDDSGPCRDTPKARAPRSLSMRYALAARSARRAGNNPYAPELT
jgi:hypothetical protein